MPYGFSCAEAGLAGLGGEGNFSDAAFTFCIMSGISFIISAASALLCRNGRWRS